MTVQLCTNCTNLMRVLNSRAKLRAHSGVSIWYGVWSPYAMSSDALVMGRGYTPSQTFLEP